jgi:IS30 family transposase
VRWALGDESRRGCASASRDVRRVAGGISRVAGRCLTFSEREEIAVARAGGESMRSTARRLGRSLSTISRGLVRPADRAGGYRVTRAHARAYVRASRPKPAKLAVNLRLHRHVKEDLRRRYSPEQIVGRLRRQFLTI